jgi:hypothetical protein
MAKATETHDRNGHRRSGERGLVFSIAEIADYDDSAPRDRDADSGRIFRINGRLTPPPFNEDVLPGLVERYREQGYGDAVPVVYDAIRYFVYDARHRIEAMRRAGLEVFEGYILQGSISDARIRWAQARVQCGQPKRAYRRFAIAQIVIDPDLGKLSDSEIGRLAGVDHKTVASVRREILGTSQVERMVRRGSQIYKFRVPSKGPAPSAPDASPLALPEAKPPRMPSTALEMLGEVDGIGEDALRKLLEAIEETDLGDPEYLLGCDGRDGILPSLRHVFDGHVRRYRFIMEIVAPLIPGDAALRRRFAEELEGWSRSQPPAEWKPCKKCGEVETGDYSRGSVLGDSQAGGRPCDNCGGLRFVVSFGDPDFVHPSLAPRLADMPRMPTKREINAIRAQIGDDLLPKLDDEIEAFEDILEAMRKIEKEWKRGAVGDHSDYWRLAECYIEDGGPDSITPCPYCKDEAGRSRGHNGNRMCLHCRWRGYTGFGVKPGPIPESGASAPARFALHG